MPERWRDEERYGRGYRSEDRGEYGGGECGELERTYGSEAERGPHFGERGASGFGRGYGRDYGSEGGRYGGLSGRGVPSYNPRSDYDRGGFGYSSDYGREPEREFGEYGRPYGYGREYERDYARTPAAAYGRPVGEEGYGRYTFEDTRRLPGFRDYEREGPRGGRERSWWDRASDEVRSWFGSEEYEGRRNFRGIGPKGYTRSDDRIREDVCDELTNDPVIDASGIEVKVSNGEVTLSGIVEEREDKRRAEDGAESIAGVKNVQNLLRVEEGAFGRVAAGTEPGRRTAAPESETTGSSTTGSVRATAGTAEPQKT